MAVFGVLALLADGAGPLLRRGQAGSLNVRGAYLDVMSDLLGAGAVVVAAGVLATRGCAAPTRSRHC